MVMTSERRKRDPKSIVLTASQKICPFCSTRLRISQNRERTIHQLGESLRARLRDKRCPNLECPRPGLIYPPLEECTLALPGNNMGLEVVLEIGAARMREDLSFPRIHARLEERGVPIGRMTVQNQFRNYLSLVGCQAGLKDERLLRQLREQGAVLPIVDGIQFGEGEPVLYMIIDALSRRPLFGAQMLCRGADELTPFIAQIKKLGVPILAVVSDKEKGLSGAIEAALPGVPHQYCQLHYVHNAAKPMEEDLRELNAEVRRTEQDLRKIERVLHRKQRRAEEAQEPIPADLPIARKFCSAARAEAQRHSRAPFAPPSLKRHQGMEKVAKATAQARRKKGGPGNTLKRSKVF